MPALLTSTSTDLKRDSAVSTILAAVTGSPMWPSRRASWLEATASVDWVTLRELATTLKPRSTNAFTIPAPIPCDAPVTMAVFRVLLMMVYLETDFSQVEQLPFTGISGMVKRIRNPRPARYGNAPCLIQVGQRPH